MSSTKAFVFGDLSPELIIQVLHSCDCLTILRFAATCKTHRELVAQTTSLQLHIELESNGLELAKGSSKQDVTYSVILDDLRRFRDAWLDLNIGEPIEREVGESEMLLWELREGFYIKAFSQSTGRLADALQFIPLDSETPDPPPLRFDFTFSEFTADPGQGLAALIFRDPQQGQFSHIHLCSSTTGLAHPLAQHPRLTAEFDFELPPGSSSFAIEIMGHVVLAKVSSIQTTTYELLIWDWRSGILLHRISSREGMCDFTFLDPQHLVVLSVARSAQDSLALLVYTVSDGTIIPQDGKSNGQIRVEHISVSQPILRLEFPRIKESDRISGDGFLLRSDPTPGRTIKTKFAAFTCTYTTTLSINFCFCSPGSQWGTPPFYRVFADGRSLLDHLHANRGDETTVLPWSSWGTNATRWFTSPDEPDHWICWMSNSRYIRSLSDYPYYCIFDFSSMTTARFRDRLGQLYPIMRDHLDKNSSDAAGEEFGDLEWINEHLLELLDDPPTEFEPLAITFGKNTPSVIDKHYDPGFDEQITSRLPCRLVCRRNDTQPHEGWQINGDCVVGVASWGPSAESITIYKLKRNGVSDIGI